MLTPTEARDATTREWTRFVSLLRSLDERQWNQPSGLADWAVRDLVAHTVWGTSMEADALRRWRTGAAGPADGQVVRSDGEPSVLLAALETSVRELARELEQIETQDADRPVPMPYGDMPLGLVLQIFVMEAGVHAYDLAACVGAVAPLPPDVVAATIPVVAAFLPVFSGNATEKPAEGAVVGLRSPSIDLRFAFTEAAWTLAPEAESALVLEADDSTLLLFALGRVSATEVAGPDPVRDKFKDWFPGP